MPKGDTHKKRHNKGISKISKDLKLPKAEDGERIGQVIKPFGSCRFGIKIIDDNLEVNASAQRSFKAGPKKEIIKVNDYVVVQPGISTGQYFINHLYSENDIVKLYEIGHIGKPNISKTIDESDVVEDVEEQCGELSLDDIWDI